jgi:hypothetical protein
LSVCRVSTSFAVLLGDSFACRSITCIVTNKGDRSTAKQAHDDYSNQPKTKAPKARTLKRLVSVLGSRFSVFGFEHCISLAPTHEREAITSSTCTTRFVLSFLRFSYPRKRRR